MDKVISPYDHHNLSEMEEFQAVNPTSEILAQTIYRKLADELAASGVKVSKVSIAESAASRIIYSE